MKLILFYIRLISTKFYVKNFKITLNYLKSVSKLFLRGQEITQIEIFILN